MRKGKKEPYALRLFSCCAALTQYGECRVALHQKGRVIQFAKQHDGSLYAEIVDVYINNGRLRFDQGRVRVAVECEESDIVGNPQLFFLQRIAEAEGKQAVFAYDGTGRIRQGKKRHGMSIGVLFG